MTKNIDVPKHLDKKVWMGALYIHNATSKQDAADRIAELLHEEGDEFMSYCMALLCLPDVMRLVRQSDEYKEHEQERKTRQYN
mgnify:FL=1